MRDTEICILLQFWSAKGGDVLSPSAVSGGWPSTSGEVVIWSGIRGDPFLPQPYHQLQNVAGSAEGSGNVRRLVADS